LAAAVAVAVGCADLRDHSEMSDIYELVTVNGDSLPVVIEKSEETEQVVIRGSLTLRADGSATFITETDVSIIGIRDRQVDTAEATYTGHGDEIRFLDTMFGTEFTPNG
jgi:hypothetical protein